MNLMKKYYTKTKRNTDGTKIEKDLRGNFYIGLISKVFQNNAVIQVENLSLLKDRKINMESIYPGGINYFVVIDNNKGLFLGRVYQSQVKSSDSVHKYMYSNDKENIFPEISLDLIGMIDSNENFNLTGINNVDIGDKVYFANDYIIGYYSKNLSYKNEDKLILNNVAKILNGNNKNFSIGMNTLFDRHLMVVGATNSGKSTSSLKLIDEIINNDQKILVIDPTGEYSKTFLDSELLNKKKYVLGDNVYFPINEVTINQWSEIFDLNDNSQGPATYSAIESLRLASKHHENVYVKRGKTLNEVQDDISSLTKRNSYFHLSKLAAQIEENSVEIDRNTKKYVYSSYALNTNSFLIQKINAVLENSSLINFFKRSNKNTNLLKLLDSFIKCDKKSLYIDASKISISDSIGSWIINYVCNYLVNKKKECIQYSFIMFIDEAHRYIYKHHNLGLESVAREGRKKGIFLFLTTQNPSDLPKGVISQIGSIISHRITSNEEIEVIKNLFKQNSLKQLSNLNRGEAIISSINLVNDVNLTFNKSNRIHDNQTRGFN